MEMIGSTYTFNARNGEKITLRPVVMEDAGQIVDAVKEIVDAGEFLQKERPRTKSEEEDFISDCRMKGNMYTAIEKQGTVIGIARIIKGELTMKKHTGMFRTWINSKGQGLGIGKEVMDYSIQWGKENGLYKIWLTVFSENKIAIRLYEKAGFTVEGVQKGQVIINQELQDEWYMACFLKKESE
ncbi:GNAT family N-acetyltransferase [Fictibacillus sp. KIGAM418]|uniref:GNAT family N-acetyltransferase n=1 Tax=Fictibacillus marinisediminis TaxID=2878389 RepID=A0A9X2BH32_9BACL|nr:GNAT family N-acetyltransferase [Fictibacillus marinisediminis]MCK6257143.1 GNAT family N-acetyltransferase [Fictibacillus marinisediminis]